MTRKERKKATQQKIQRTANLYWRTILSQLGDGNDFNWTITYCDRMIHREMKKDPQNAHILRSAGYLLIDWIEKAFKEWEEDQERE